jgi:hypothetical protein
MRKPSIVFTGVGSPEGQVTAEASAIYFDLANGAAYGKMQGSGSTGWTQVSTPGGASGSKWYHGSGAPSAGTGVTGDFYLNDANGDVYARVVDGWGTAVANLTGPAGPPGA